MSSIQEFLEIYASTSSFHYNHLVHKFVFILGKTLHQTVEASIIIYLYVFKHKNNGNIVQCILHTAGCVERKRPNNHSNKQHGSGHVLWPQSHQNQIFISKIIWLNQGKGY